MIYIDWFNIRQVLIRDDNRAVQECKMHLQFEDSLRLAGMNRMLKIPFPRNTIESVNLLGILRYSWSRD